MIAAALPGFENGLPPDSLRRPGLFLITFDPVLYYLLGNLRLQPAAGKYYHAACYGAFIASVAAIELRELLAAACVTDAITTPALGQLLEAVAIDEATATGSEGGGGNRDFKIARSAAREALAPWVALPKTALARPRPEPRPQ
eukprot:jgi/Tetstr1/439879/TSEL_028287.t1